MYSLIQIGRSHRGHPGAKSVQTCAIELSTFKTPPIAASLLDFPQAYDPQLPQHYRANKPEYTRIICVDCRYWQTIYTRQGIMRRDHKRWPNYNDFMGTNQKQFGNNKVISLIRHWRVKLMYLILPSILDIKIIVFLSKLFPMISLLFGQKFCIVFLTETKVSFLGQ